MNKDIVDDIDIQLKSIRLKNFKAYEDFRIDFSNKNNVKKFVCFMGENGAGKTTILNVIQMIFQRYDGYDPQRLINTMNHCIRHDSKGINDNFLIEADIISSFGNYQIKIDKNGFIKDHPKEIKEWLYRLCYYTKFDRDLHQFQLSRGKWNIFKELFESVTGYEIEEYEGVFSISEDPSHAELLNDYILGFIVKKPFETISHKECSNGEKKVIKSFSTLLNLEISPKIILIDDIAMHVALNKHLALVDCMKKCYPESQIFSTTHSYRITKNLNKIDEIYDLRVVNATDIIKAEPWRLRLIDEIDDSLYKLNGMGVEKSHNLYKEGEKIKTRCSLYIRDLCEFRNDVKKFLEEVSRLYIIGFLSHCDRSLKK